MRGIRIVLGLVGVFALATTAAADQSMYFGGGLGLYDLKIDGGSSYSPPTAGVEQFSLGSGESFEDSAATYHVFGGYQLNKYID